MTHVSIAIAISTELMQNLQNQQLAQRVAVAPKVVFREVQKAVLRKEQPVGLARRALREIAVMLVELIPVFLFFSKSIR